MAAATYNLPDAIRGDTWPGMTWRLNIDLAGALVRMDITPAGTATHAMQFSSTSANPDTLLTIVPGPTESTVTWPAQRIALRPGAYDYDLEITMPTGVRTTLVKGSWIIVNDITK